MSIKLTHFIDKAFDRMRCNNILGPLSAIINFKTKLMKINDNKISFHCTNNKKDFNITYEETNFLEKILITRV